MAERYASRDDYLDQVRGAVQSLVEEGYLLEEDVLRVVEGAARRYDWYYGGESQAAS
jgi:hypothetical protein